MKPQSNNSSDYNQNVLNQLRASQGSQSSSSQFPPPMQQQQSTLQSLPYGPPRSQAQTQSYPQTKVWPAPQPKISPTHLTQHIPIETRIQTAVGFVSGGGRHPISNEATKVSIFIFVFILVYVYNYFNN